MSARGVGFALALAAVLWGCADTGENPPPPPEYAKLRAAALAHLEGGAPEQAFEPAVRALAAQPRRREAYELVSRIYTEIGRDAEAVEFFAVGTRNFPDLPYGWFYKGFHEFRLGRWDDALVSFERAAALDPADPRARFRCGLIYQTMGDFERAAAELRTAYALAPEDPIVAARLARVLRILGHYEEAGQIVREALQRNPDSPDLLYALGQWQLREGDLGAAEETLRRALALAPERPEVHHDLARLLQRRGETALARRHEALARRLRDARDGYDHLRRIAAKRPGDPEPRLLLAELALAGGQAREARRWLEHARALGAAPERVRADEAQAALLAGDLQQAEALLQGMAASGDPHVALARAALAVQGREAGALERLEAAARAAPRERAFLWRLADLFERAGAPDRALAWLEQAGGTPWSEQVPDAGAMASALD